jgi:hypothetical protein
MKKRHRNAGATFRPPMPSMALSALERLQQRAMADGREEPAFFRALLDATVYAHVPLHDDSGRVRFIQFVRPDNGTTVLPFFTDVAKADAVGRTDAKIVAARGRDFLELTFGATLMLNPNDASCVLYPEEVAALLATGGLPRCENEIVQTDRTLGFRLPISAPDWFEPALVQVLSSLPYIQQAYLVEMLPPENPSHVTLLISLGVEPSMAERAARAVSAGMQHRWQNLQVPVDLMTYDPNDGPPEWATAVEAAPIYDRQPPAKTKSEGAVSAK